MINLTPKAKEKLLELQGKGDSVGPYCLRVKVRGGGCSGLLYDLSFDQKIEQEDHVYDLEEMKILVDKKSLLYVTGTTLDFSDGLNGKGFQFVNPNATRTCGCGESFAL